MSVKNIFVTLTFVIFASFFAFCVYQINQKFDYIKQIELANDISVSSEWTYIAIDDLIRFEKDNHYISIKLPFNNRASEEHINPKVKVIDETGTEFALKFSGGRLSDSGEYMKYGMDELPRNRNYTKLAIKNKVPIKLRKIYWSGYNTEDLK